MTKIELLTNNGGFVGQFHIPPFEVLPDVVVWGTRTFKWSGVGTTFKEVFSYTIVTKPIS